MQLLLQTAAVGYVGSVGQLDERTLDESSIPHAKEQVPLMLEEAIQ